MKKIRDRSGQGLTEYIVLLMLIAVSCIAIVSSIGTQVHTKLQSARNAINSEVVRTH